MMHHTNIQSYIINNYNKTNTGLSPTLLPLFLCAWVAVVGGMLCKNDKPSIIIIIIIITNRTVGLHTLGRPRPETCGLTFPGLGRRRRMPLIIVISEVLDGSNPSSKQSSKLCFVEGLDPSRTSLKTLITWDKSSLKQPTYLLKTK